MGACGAALGVGAAYGGSELLKGYARQRIEAVGDEPVIVKWRDEGRMPFLGRLPDGMRDKLWDRLEKFREHRLEEKSDSEQ